MATDPTVLSADTTITDSGLYIVSLAGITITLPVWAVDFSITVKDVTGSSSPNIIINTQDGSTIDLTSSIVLSNGKESVTILSYITNQFIVL